MFLHKFDFKTLIKVFNEILMRFSFEKKKNYYICQYLVFIQIQLIVIKEFLNNIRITAINIINS